MTHSPVIVSHLLQIHHQTLLVPLPKQVVDVALPLAETYDAAGSSVARAALNTTPVGENDENRLPV
jgi:hypothetical protein